MSSEVRRTTKSGGDCAGREREPRRSETGSALLIVFLFAAVVAIMLYMELPVAAFEAERDREQLVIDRGNEYAHAVKLFVRKFGMYPASLDQLENTNRMRFLRHRFKDPLTGKDDWRLLHAGPNGQLLDSKVSPISKVSNGDSNSGAATGESSGGNAGPPALGGGFNPGTATAGSSPANANVAAAGGFNSVSSSTASDVVVPSVPQRPPAIVASGNRPPSASQAEQDPMTPLLATNQTANTATTPQNGSSTPGVQPAQPTDQNVTQTAAQNGADAAAQGNAQAAGATGSPNGMATVRNLLTSPNLAAQSTSSRMGVITSGGIAGVASKAEGRSIKTVNDQTEYSLWEFYYDPTKDAMRGITSALQAGAAQAGAAQSGGVQPGVQIGGRNFPTQNSTGQNSATVGGSPGSSSTPAPPPESVEPEPPEASENPPQ
jgi:hypothetical protein